MAGKNLTVYLTSDVSKFRNGLSKAERDARGFGSRMGGIGKKAGLALAGGLAVGAAAAATFAVEGIQAAISDQSSQAQLKLAMKNTTKATDEQVASMEEWIKTQQELTGISDEDLRPAMARFLRSTKDVARAQSLAETAMSISVATGKDYVSVASALAKAEDGTTQSLKRLGLTIGPLAQNYTDMIGASRELAKAEENAATVREESGPKSKEYAKALEKVKKAQEKIASIKGNGGTKWVKELNTQFDGAITADAKTYAGGVRRVSDAWGELQEAFGTGVLDNLGDGNEKMGDFAATLYEAQDDAEAMGKFVGDIATGLADTAKYIGPVVDKFNEWNNMGDGVLTNGQISNFFDKIVPGVKVLAGMVTGNQQAVAEAVQDTRQEQINAANAAALAAQASQNNMFSSSSLYSVDPNRSRSNRQVRDGRSNARGAQREARTGNRP
jgi:putative NIF3 family GTP cyclohydrolase 1 type 2